VTGERIIVQRGQAADEGALKADIARHDLLADIAESETVNARRVYTSPRTHADEEDSEARNKSFSHEITPL
jgi:hypothetical protein